MKHKKIISLFCAAAASSFSFADVFFSGFSGAKTELTSDKTSDKFDPQMKIRSFFSGQLNFSENIIAHGEFSLQTHDLLDKSLFKETPATFRLDELSLIFRQPMGNERNYLSFFAGTYEPIGSDVFLRRHFGIQPITSRITESWLGLGGSIIYPVFGFGIADAIRFSRAPFVIGNYLYVNREFDESYVLNIDVRTAFVSRFFTFDFSGGIGMPLNTTVSDEAFIIVDTIFWRAGMNVLIGNRYTTSLFMQAGLSDVPFTKRDQQFILNEEKTYILLEPRFRMGIVKMHITAFSLPHDTVEKFIFINDSMGMNLDLFMEEVYIHNKAVVLGMNTALTLPGKNFIHFQEPEHLFDTHAIIAAPYFSTGFYNGELRAMLQMNIMDITNGNAYSAFKIHLGYRTQF